MWQYVSKSDALSEFNNRQNIAIIENIQFYSELMALI